MKDWEKCIQKIRQKNIKTLVFGCIWTSYSLTF